MQNFLAGILQGSPCCFMYLDNVRIFLKMTELHHSHLTTVFQCLNDAGIVINPLKDSMYLGTDTSAVESAGDPEHATPRNSQRPTSFLRMVNCYWCHLCNAAAGHKHLTAAQRGPTMKGRAPIAWTYEMEQICTTSTSDLELTIIVDSSQTAISTPLQQ
ncbi:uncharacterized protein LOC124775817 [Schistocerca piceifrons]|uniref:uncharacterized protein LOC124775817 n=1 Tax=Schistocerca piceifrons TaxID=274613 RepID=UPI001F5FDCD4|nr:uncharacterized protein LOC124775817 [Schistocerca piceifrons]